VHRAWQQLVIGAVLACVLLTSGTALAFHAGNLFDAEPGSGGGGGLFYVGSPRERGWTCAACHLNAPRRTRVAASSDPPELIGGGAYAPGQRYRLTFVLENEYLGLSSPRSNYNTIVLSAISGQTTAAGSFSGYAAEDYHARGTAILASAGRTPNETTWAFDWTAPVAGTGQVRLFVAVVDGNAAKSDPNVTLTDPFGDDLAVGQLTFAESGTVVGSAVLPPARYVFGGEGAPDAAPTVKPLTPRPAPLTTGLARILALGAALAVALGLLASALLGRRPRVARAR